MGLCVDRTEELSGQARERWKMSWASRNCIPRPIFCPVYDAFSPADFRTICSISRADYIVKFENKQIDASYNFTTSFNAGFAAHNFYDMVGFAYLSKAEASSFFSLHSDVAVNIFLDIFNEIFDLDSNQHFEEWKGIFSNEIHGCMEQNRMLFDRREDRFSEVHTTVTAAMHDVCLMVEKANVIANLGRENRERSSSGFLEPPLFCFN